MAGMVGNICDKSIRGTGNILSGHTKPAENTMGNEVNKIITVTSSGLGINRPINIPKKQVANKYGIIN